MVREEGVIVKCSGLARKVSGSCVCHAKEYGVLHDDKLAI